jgi:nicotinamide-nucleotide amidase
MIVLPRIEIVSTGTEILQGLYPDTNAQWMSARLVDMGLPVAYHAAAPDSKRALVEQLLVSTARSDVVLISGGLGPTEDDVNRFAIAEVYGLELAEDAGAVEGMRRYFERRKRPFREANRVQALLPRGARVLYNEWGTAPGFLIEGDAEHATLIALPGPPRELQPMFEKWVRPYLLSRYEPGERLRVLTLHTIQLPESEVNAAILDLWTADPRVNVALLAATGKVDIRLTGRAPEAEVDRLLEEFRRRIEERLEPDAIYGVNEETLESVVGRMMNDQGLTIALAESCTAGMAASRLADVPGASKYLREAFVTYADEAKIERLGVAREVIERHGAVSAETAQAMAEGVRRVARTSLGLSITGIAGPTGGTPEKPVGLVFIGLAGEEGSTVVERRFLGNRNENRVYSVNAALDLVRRRLLRRSRNR